MNPELSLILPIRNYDKVLRKCITSLNNQTFTDFEVIVSDSSHTNYAKDVERKLHLQEERIRILAPTPGACHWQQMASGVAAARGKYVLFLNPRQWLSPDAAERLTTRMNESGADLVTMQLVKHISALKVKNTPPDDTTPTDTLIFGEELRELTRFIGDGSMISTSMTDKIYRRDLLREALAIKFPGEERCDEILNINYLRHARSVLLLSYRGLNCNWQDTSTEYRYAALEDAKHAYTFKQLCGQDPERISEELRQRLNHHVYSLIVEQGWTRDATVYFLDRELNDPIWREVGVVQSASELLPAVPNKQLKDAISDILKKLLR